MDQEVRLGPGGQPVAAGGEQPGGLGVPVLVLQRGDQFGEQRPGVGEQPERLAQRCDGEEGDAAFDAAVAEVVEGLGVLGPFRGGLGGAGQVLEPGRVGQGAGGLGQFGEGGRLGVRPQGPYGSGQIAVLEQSAHVFHGVGHRLDPGGPRAPAATYFPRTGVGFWAGLRSKP
ncbi:hypothetical protein [Streptomyces xanthophaeus]|uniref:hypothetical protein n=1 Tax=Streptomyces xanthophaeus TaxID=67385 RepID=UPI003662E5CD